MRAWRTGTIHVQATPLASPLSANPTEASMQPENETLEMTLARNVRDALMEDIGRGDWTARLVPSGRRVTGRVVASAWILLP
jgi:hypothetical protein